jgi:sulfate transport system substrate-binding protein
VITSNPKNSSNARWNYLAAWGYAFKRSGGSHTAAREFVRKLYANVKVLDSGPQSSVNIFAGRGVGDVLLAWENEAHLLSKEGNGDKFEVVTPSLSILAEPAVSVISDAPDQAYGTRAYIDYLYSTNAQDIAAKHYYRPRDEKVAAKYSPQFPQIDLFTVDEVFGGWKEAQNVHFSNGGVFDQIQEPGIGSATDAAG